LGRFLALGLGLFLARIVGRHAVCLLGEDLNDVRHLVGLAVEDSIFQQLRGIGGKPVRDALEDCALELCISDSDSSCCELIMPRL